MSEAPPDRIAGSALTASAASVETTERERDDESVDVDLAEPRDARAHGNPVQESHARRGDRDAERAADGGEDQRFGERDVQQERAIRAQRAPDGELALPPLRAREEQVGDVRTGQEQQHPDGAEHDPQYLRDVRDHHVAKRLHDRAHLRRGDPRGGQSPGIDHGNLRKQALQVRRRRRRRDAVAKPADSLVIERGRLRVRGVDPERDPQLGPVAREMKVRAGDADDLMLDARDRHPPPDDRGIGTEGVLPEALRDHGDRRRVRCAVRLAERSPPDGRGAEDAKQAGRDQRGGYVPWGVRAARRSGDRMHVDGRGAVDADVREHPVGLAVEQVGRVGLIHAREPGDGERMREVDEPFGVRIGQWPEQHAVDHGEDRRGAADAQRECQDRGGGESRAPREAARRMTALMEHASR